MNIKPEQIPDEVVEAAVASLAVAMEFGDTWPDDYTDEQRSELRQGVRTSLAATLPVLLGEPVAWMRRSITYKDTDGRRDGERILSERKVFSDDIAIYTLPTQDTPMPTNKPEVVLPEFKRADSLAQRCADILLWRKTGSLPDDSALRAFASQQQFDKHEPHRLQGAEYATLQEAAEQIADTLTRPAGGEFVMVPREPTREMMTAAFTVKLGKPDWMRLRYQAMLSAAPQKSGQEVGEVESIGRAFLSVLGDPNIAWRNTGAHEFIERVSQATAKQKSAAPQQPAEAVAGFVDSEQLDELKRGECVAIQLGTYSRRYRRTLPVYTSTPPAIDIGKLRELVSEWRNDAKHKVIRVMAKQQLADADQLAALIGDGGEAGAP